MRDENRTTDNADLLNRMNGVFASVLSSSYDFKILNPVVGLDPIFMMYKFGSE